MNALTRLFPRPARVTWHRRAGMTEPELAAALAHAPGHPLWLATLEILDQHIEDAQNSTLATSKAGDGETKWALGAVEALARLRADLEQREAASRK